MKEVYHRLTHYLRSTILQSWLNNIPILNIYSDIADNLDIDKLIDKFISINSKRSKIFVLNKKLIVLTFTLHMYTMLYIIL